MFNIMNVDVNDSMVGIYFTKGSGKTTTRNI